MTQPGIFANTLHKPLTNNIFRILFVQQWIS